MAPSSDSEDDYCKQVKGFRLSSSGTPVNWNGNDWPFYKQAMQNVFENELLDEVADGTEKAPDDGDEEKKKDYKKRQAKLKMVIQGSLSKRLAKMVMSKKTGTETWAALNDTYDGKQTPAMVAQKVYRLLGTLDRTSLRTGGDVRSHLFTLFGVFDELKELGHPMDELMIVDKLLRSLPGQRCYDELRRKVLFSTNMSKYTPDIVREMILTAETRAKEWETNAFGARNQTGRVSIKGKGKKGNQTKANQGDGEDDGGNKVKKAKATVECFNCGEKGHYKSECPELKDSSNAATRRNAQAKYVRSADLDTEQRAKMDESHSTAPTPKRDIKINDALLHAPNQYDPSQWYFDTRSDAHIVATTLRCSMEWRTVTGIQ